MSVYFEYASFPNSRIKSRNPTVEAITAQVLIKSQNDVAPELTLVKEASLNRTYIIVENLSDSFDTYYFYCGTEVVNPTVVARFGVVDDKIWNPTTKVLYNKTDVGLNTNWVVVPATDYHLVGQKISPFQAATLESLQDIYAIGMQPAATTLTLGIDQGRG